MSLSHKARNGPSRKAGEVELDLGRYELRRGGRRIRLAKKPMELLIFLVARREQLVQRQDIVARLWPSDLFIDTERNINNLVRTIRRALGDRTANPRFVETVVGKGYRFIGPLQVIGPLYPLSGSSEGFPGKHRTATEPAGSEHRCSLAVLPLAAQGDFKDDTGMCQAFADALASRLANLEGVDVLPTSSTLSLPPDLSPCGAASRLGARFVVRGAIQNAQRESRLWVELFDSHVQSSCFTRNFVFDGSHPFERIEELATCTSRALKRPLQPPQLQARSRYSRDPLAYAEFLQGYQRSSSGDPKLLEEAAQHLMNSVARDPEFALAHASLSFVCAARHFEFDPRRSWLEQAEFHCQRALQLDSTLPEAHVARAFLMWGPLKNFQHMEAIAELKRALTLQKNLPHAYNRLGTILAHIGLLDHARTMYERGSWFDPGRKISHSICQVYLWSGDYERAATELRRWRGENPASKYAIYFALQAAMLMEDWKQAGRLLREGVRLLPQEPLLLTLQAVMHARRGRPEPALRCVNRACANPRSFGHAHHTYYQIACVFSLLDRIEPAMEWLERSVDTGFACWPLFLKDPCLENVRNQPRFELLVSSLQARYPEHLGTLEN